MGRARVKKGGARARFPLWEENPRELWVRIITENNEGERSKAGRVNLTLRLMPSPNYMTHACKKGRGTRTVHSLRGKSSGIMSRNYPWIYFWELSHSISSRRKVEIYRDTGVSKFLVPVPSYDSSSIEPIDFLDPGR